MVLNKIITESDGVFILCFCQYCVVSCRTIPLTATSQSVSSRPGAQDFVEKTGQVLGIDFFFFKEKAPYKVYICVYLYNQYHCFL